MKHAIIRIRSKPMKIAVNVLGSLRREKGFEGYWSFIVIIEHMVNTSVRLDARHENSLRELVGGVGVRFVGIDENKIDQPIWVEAHVAALPIATWLNTCNAH